jgi:hypothetical protein
MENITAKGSTTLSRSIRITSTGRSATTLKLAIDFANSPQPPAGKMSGMKAHPPVAAS